MESCTRCGVRAEEHPIIAIMKVSDADDLKDKQPVTVLAIGGPSDQYAAVPVCTHCHETPWEKDPLPRIKGAFFVRGDMSVALRMANFPTDNGGRMGGSTIKKK